MKGGHRIESAIISNVHIIDVVRPFGSFHEILYAYRINIVVQVFADVCIEKVRKIVFIITEMCGERIEGDGLGKVFINKIKRTDHDGEIWCRRKRIKFIVVKQRADDHIDAAFQNQKRGLLHDAAQAQK